MVGQEEGMRKENMVRPQTPERYVNNQLPRLPGILTDVKSWIWWREKKEDETQD